MSVDKTSAENIHTAALKKPDKLSPELEAWLDSAIESKVNLIQFKSSETDPKSNLSDPGRNNPEDIEDNPVSTINLSRYGLKNPNDLKVFLISPAGDTVKAEIGERIAHNKAEEEQLKFEQQEQEKRHSIIKSLLMLWLLEEKGHAADQLRELIDADNEKALNQSKQLANPSENKSTEAKNNKELQEAMSNYDEAIKEHETKRKDLETNETNLKQELKNLEKQEVALDAKHDVYNESVKEFEEQSKSYEEMSKTELDAKITSMENEVEAMTDPITKMLDSSDPDAEEKARVLMNKQNALNLQLGSLYDLRDTKFSAKEGEDPSKSFYNAQGQKVTSQKDAEYIVGNDKQLVADENGKLYLVKAGVSLDELDETEKEEAARDFDDAKDEMRSVSKTVENNVKLEKDFHHTRIDETQLKLDVNSTEKMMLENDMKLMQSTRANLSAPNNNLAPSDAPTPVPTSSHSTGKVNAPPPPTSMIGVMKDLIPLFKRKPGPSEEDVLNSPNAKNSKNPEEAKQYLNLLLKKVSTGKINSLSPLPPTTMSSMLQHMERFGLNAYKVGSTKSPSPEPEVGPKLEAPKDSKEAPDPLQAALNDLKKLDSLTPKPKQEKPEAPTPQNKHSPFNMEPNPNNK